MNALKSYGAHGLAYLMSILSIAAGADPALLALLGPHAMVYAGAAGLILTAVHNIQAANAPAAPLPAPAAGTVVKALLAGLLACLLALGTVTGLSACATTPTAQQQAGISAAIYVAAGAAIQQGSSDPAVWKARATEFKAIAVELQSVNSSGTATLPTLAADLQPLVAKLGPADVLAANALVGALTPYLQDQVKADPSLAKVQAAVAYLLSTVINACTAYGA